MKKVTLILFLFSLICCNSFAQQINLPDTNKVDNDTAQILAKSEKLPRFDLHLAAGVVSGGRVGLRILFLKNYSAEFSYGYNLFNFLGATNPNERYGLGVNWHKDNSNFVFSLLGVISHDIYTGQKKSYFVSPTIGWVTFKSEGLHTFIRFGIAIQFNNNTSSGSYTTTFWPNLDAGITFVIY